MDLLFECVCACVDKVVNLVKSWTRAEEIIEFDHSFRVSVGKKIAEGGFSVVFEARNCSESNCRPNFALKRVICGDRECVNNCREEIAIHRLFNHPNLMPLVAGRFYPQGTTSLTICYMLFPLLPFSLRDEITKRNLLAGDPSEVRPFAQREMLEIFASVADGVLTMHNRGFSHRDIKVENVMINSTGMPILMDFGSVGPVIVPLLTRADQFKLIEEASSNCSMPYRAPELFDGGCRYGENEPNVDGRIDVWSLGCLLFAMMYGASPFECEFREERVKVVDCSHLRVLGNVPTASPHSVLASRYSNEIFHFVKWLLTVDRTVRPTIEELCDRLDEILKSYGSSKKWTRKDSCSMNITSSAISSDDNVV